MTNIQTGRYLNTMHCSLARETTLLKIICLAFIIIVSTLPLAAQLKLYPVPKSPSSKTALQSKSKSAARVQDDTPLTLPFWDDFSTYSLDENELPTANYNLWTNSKSVSINSGMSVNEPTINVATFDGLDSANLPYSPTQIFVSGFTDKLISKPIDLTLPSNQTNSVYLSFFYQWMGNGEAPDKNDFLLLEFKDKKEKWQEIQRIYPGANPDRTIFIYSIFNVDTSYQSKDFQFRFRSNGRESGPVDTWNLDYIYLDKNRTAGDNSFPDRAIASELSSIFDTYRTVPLNHFFDKKPLDSLKFYVKSLETQQNLTAVNFIPTTKFKKYYASDTVVYTAIGDSTAINNNGADQGGLINPLQRMKVRVKNYLDPDNVSQFDPMANSIELEFKINIKTGDDNDPLKIQKFPKTDFKVNDSITSFYNLSDYYAYDDGIAEYSVGLTQPGNYAVCEFNTFTNVEDTLTGFDVYFPDFAIIPNLATRFFVFGKLMGIDGKTDSTLAIETVSIQQNGLNHFKRVAVSPIIVPIKFYIGWIETSSNPVKIGLDTSNDTGDKIFVKVDGAWSLNTIVHGSLMIRPVFGKSSDVISAVPEEKPTKSGVYPNPNSGTFFVQGNYDVMKIINTTGQPVPFSTEAFGDELKVTLQATPGLYIIQLQKGISMEVKKIIVR